MRFRARMLQYAVLLLNVALFMHFVVGISLTLRLASGLNFAERCVFVLPYAGIAIVFVVGIALAPRHLPWATGVLVLGLVLSSVACAYDLTHHRFQGVGGGIGESYTIWWWYYEPFWYGYTPGNV